MKPLKPSRSAVRMPAAPRPLLEHPAVALTLRVATAGLMCTATTLVLTHLIVYSGGALTSTQARVPATCLAATC